MGWATKVAVGLGIVVTTAIVAVVAATRGKTKADEEWAELAAKWETWRLESQAEIDLGLESAAGALEALAGVDELRGDLETLGAQLEAAETLAAQQRVSLQSDLENANAEAEAFKEELVRTQSLLEAAVQKKKSPAAKRTPRKKTKKEQEQVG